MVLSVLLLGGPDLLQLVLVGTIDDLEGLVQLAPLHLDPELSQHLPLLLHRFKYLLHINSQMIDSLLKILMVGVLLFLVSMAVCVVLGELWGDLREEEGNEEGNQLVAEEG